VLKTRLLRHLNCFFPPDEMMTVEFSACALPSISLIINEIGPSSCLGLKAYASSTGYNVVKIKSDDCSNSQSGCGKRRLNKSRPGDLQAGSTGGNWNCGRTRLWRGETVYGREGGGRADCAGFKGGIRGGAGVVRGGRDGLLWGFVGGGAGVVVVGFSVGGLGRGGLVVVVVSEEDREVAGEVLRVRILANFSANSFVMPSCD